MDEPQHWDWRGKLGERPSQGQRALLEDAQNISDAPFHGAALKSDLSRDGGYVIPDVSAADIDWAFNPFWSNTLPRNFATWFPAPTKPRQTDRDTQIAYLKMKVEEGDWHAVSDAANDLRVMEARGA